MPRGLKQKNGWNPVAPTVAMRMTLSKSRHRLIFFPSGDRLPDLPPFAFRVLGLAFSVDLTTGGNAVFHLAVEEGCAIDLGRIHIAVTQVSETEIGFGKVNSEQVGVLEGGVSQFGSHLGKTAIGVIQIRTFKLTIVGNAMTQLRLLQRGMCKVRVLEVGVT